MTTVMLAAFAEAVGEAVGKAGGYDAALARDEVVGDAVEGDGLAFDCDGF